MNLRWLSQRVKPLRQVVQDAWRFMQNHPPVLALALLALALVIAKATEVGFGVIVLRRGAMHVGVAAYLLGVVGFVAFGRRNQAWPALAQIGAATAFGIAVALLAQTYVTHYRQLGPSAVCAPTLAKPYDAPKQQPAGASKGEVATQHSGAKDIESRDSEAKNPLDGINVFAAVLAVALAVLTLVAQKSASEARIEAEKANEMLVSKRSEILLIEVLMRLALETQRLRNSGREQSDLFAMYEDTDSDLANLHRRWSELYGAVSVFLVDLIAVVDRGEVDQSDPWCGRIALMADDLDRTHRRQSEAAAHDLLREQVRGYVSPLRRLLSKGLKIVEIEGATPERQRELCKAMRALDKSLSVLT